nr:hypothetical protein [Pedobacter panaciterrae]
MRTKPLKLLFFFCLLAVAGTFSSCEKKTDEDKLKISYGTSFGMCAGYCNNELFISNAKMELKKHENKPNAVPKVCTGEMAESEWSKLAQNIDLSVFNKLKQVYGCPDCADGGAEWIEITYGDKKHKVTFEYGKEPNQVKPYISILRAQFDTFKDCK